jgi:hypothetical protein
MWGRACTQDVAQLLVEEGIDAPTSAASATRVRILKGVRDHEFGLRAVFADPDGNRTDVGEIRTPDRFRHLERHDLRPERPAGHDRADASLATTLDATKRLCEV